MNSLKRTHLSKITAYIILCLLGIIIIVPFLNVFSTSLKNHEQFFSRPITWIPNPPQWQHYVTLFTDLKFGNYIINSLWLAAAAVVLLVTSSSFVAFGFCRYNFPGKRVLFTILLATMMLPAQVTQIPQFIFFKQLGWLKSFKPIIVPMFFGSAFLIFLLKQFFMSIPREMDEAAKIDGCNPVKIWWKIIMPQAKPALIIASLFAFLGSWKDIFGPLIYLSKRSLYTVALGLLFFQSPTQTAYGLLMAGVTVALIPTVAIYIFAQKYLDKGINIATYK